MSAEQSQGNYAGARRAVELVMPGPNPYPATDPITRESPPHRLADSSLAARRSEGVQIAVEMAREHVGNVDTRIGDRVRARYEQRLADKIRGDGSEEGVQETVQEDSAETLGIYGKRLEAVLTGLARVVEELPKCRADREIAAQEVAAMRNQLASYGRELTGVLGWIESYKSGETKRIEQQRQIIREQFEPLKTDIQGMRGDIKYNIGETVHFFAGVVNRMDNLSGRVEEFLGVLSNAYRGLPKKLAAAMSKVRAETNAELRVIRDSVERNLSVSVLGDLTFEAVVKAASKGHSMVNYDSLNKLSGAAVQIDAAAEKLGGRLKYLEKSQSDIRRLRKIITAMRRATVAMRNNAEASDRAVLEEVDEINNSVAEEGSKTRKAIGITTLEEKERSERAYQVLTEIKNGVTGIQETVAQVVEGAVVRVFHRYGGREFTQEQCGQIAGIMVGGLLSAYDNMPPEFYTKIEASVTAKFGDAFRGFARAIGESGVKLSAKGRKELLDEINGKGGLGGRMERVEEKLKVLESRLPAGDLLTEAGVRKVVREEVGQVMSNLEPTVKGYIDTAIERTAGKIAASRPKREPRPEGERRERKPKEEKVASPESLIAGFTRLIRRKPGDKK